MQSGLLNGLWTMEETQMGCFILKAKKRGWMKYFFLSSVSKNKLIFNCRIMIKKCHLGMIWNFNHLVTWALLIQCIGSDVTSSTLQVVNYRTATWRTICENRSWHCSYLQLIQTRWYGQDCPWCARKLWRRKTSFFSSSLHFRPL